MICDELRLLCECVIYLYFCFYVSYHMLLLNVLLAGMWACPWGEPCPWIAGMGIGCCPWQVAGAGAGMRFWLWTWACEATTCRFCPLPFLATIWEEFDYCTREGLKPKLVDCSFGSIGSVLKLSSQ